MNERRERKVNDMLNEVKERKCCKGKRRKGRVSHDDWPSEDADESMVHLFAAKVLP